MSKRTKTSLKAILDLDDVDVSILPHDELVSHFTTLQTAYKAIETAACKQGTARWQYSGVVPAQSVFYKLFDLPIPTKKKDMWKQKKLPTETFHRDLPQGDRTPSGRAGDPGA
ncbi:hypothetical protein JCM11641_002124 [Rhodosporidiobolus odoratus]